MTDVARLAAHVAGMGFDLIEVPIDGLGQHFSNLERCAAGSILLESMMSLDDLDIVLLPQRPGHFTDHLVDQIHPDAHVGRAHAGDLPGEGFELLQLNGVETGRADHVSPGHVGGRPTAGR